MLLTLTSESQQNCGIHIDTYNTNTSMLLAQVYTVRKLIVLKAAPNTLLSKRGREASRMLQGSIVLSRR
jgi:hypothetical protein